ncbi:indole-diterpene biosynthesis protein-like protein PaxU [Lentithecium fluviatile CBS 122367]|uniref:Indole-diterpene biosynthesis protein-like protein PaxU n=1 Tax=Lentithecium fluviatile CBS 122367 TaxID=1168545 RepID=A0A6G1JFX7_9PLEO|nr:indole-diterpene biosynthesis protein-like protein PaxU [Lentithecium fluviatile CBS 122367]
MASAKAGVLDPVFTKLGPRMSLYTPPGHAPGQLVVLCTWLGAAPKHINKYILSHRTIAPHSRILLVQSDVSILTTSYPAQRKAIKPAVQAVWAVIGECGQGNNHWTAPQPKILIHTFSNGGTNSATQILLELGEERGKPLPVVGIMCDSGPAKGAYWKSYHSMLLSMPKGLAKTVGPLVVQFILVVLFTSIAIGRYDKPEDLWRRTLLDAKFVTGTTRKEGRICYMFSKADDHVDWHDIAEHADMARSKGWEVAEIDFEGTLHCNHFTNNAERYSDMMQRLWKGVGLIDKPRAQL